MIVDELRNKFLNYFGEEPQIFRAPGRVNIIGEHTDYNDGLVLPFPIAQSIYFAATKRDDNEIHIHALDLNKTAVISSHQQNEQEPWMRYFTAANRVLIEDGFQFGGLNIMARGDIPFGAGISSSSALTCGFIYAITKLYSLNISRRDIVFLASRAENSTGLQGGKMDQFAICMGKAGKAILLDCRDYSYQLIPATLKNASWILFNTNVAHNLADTEYNDRRKDCEDGFAYIQSIKPTLNSVRDLTHEDLNNAIHLISKKQFDRLTHVIEENNRVLEMVKALAAEDLVAIGNLLFESHRSLAELYQVSCEELDFIVSHLKDQHYCYGARMMGGGFGGSVIALINEEEANYEPMEDAYSTAFNLNLEVIPVISNDGVYMIPKKQYV